MIKRNNKKGFTIVELVIVIAVIAILAAVLIPTFAGIIKKANLSADEQAVRQMNTALAMYEAENGKPANLITAKKALDEALVNVEGGLVPVTQGYAFYWDKANNKVVLVGDSKDVKDGWELLSNNGLGTTIEISNSSTAGNDIKEAIHNSSDAAPVIITLKEDVTSNVQINALTGDAAVIDLNGKKLTITADGEKNPLVYAYKGGKIEIKNGTLVLSGNNDEGIRNLESSLSLKNVVIESTAKTTVFVKGFSDTSIVDCKINGKGDWGIATNSTAAAADGARVTIENSKISAVLKPFFCSINANFVANNSTFTATGSEGNAVTLKDGTHEFNNCKFVSPADGSAIYFVDGAVGGYSGEVSAKFNGCEHYNGETKVAKVAISHGVLGAKATVTIDGEYTITKKTDGSTGSLTINGTAIALN
ncbi:MAG: type II secretion system protein [Clostridia bacterium]|nr:type II secretion system protein [Clostridia bacterium]